ncbi:biogenesis of lysosome-related organelles complex 1 subunit 5-like [Gambusia affinis]|uniref:biogenesis of lysosome-related organelles complex 1 subunit 5-like n=1 Tax=Gambusia affinis TaxID=33528 RepID=UPI001CDBFDF1|nr:biogenesis of lysosome-related organelles complex 1 subunit 5-like [Gambusia affinis]
MMEKIAKDVGDIQSRLLDHRPVISAEVRYFVREFEEKRGLRETRLLENLNKTVQETNEQMVPANLQEMSQKLSDISKRCKGLEFLKEQQRLKEEVDEEHAKAVGEISTRFSEKKKDLAQFSL